MKKSSKTWQIGGGSILILFYIFTVLIMASLFINHGRVAKSSWELRDGGNLASVPKKMRQHLEEKKLEFMLALSSQEKRNEKRKWLIRSLMDAHRIDSTEQKQIFAEYKQLRELASKSRQTNHGTFVWVHGYEEGYGMRRPFDKKTVYYSIKGTRGGHKVPCGFTLCVWGLRWGWGGEQDWVDIDDRNTAVLNVDWDHEADGLSVDPILRYGSYAFAPFAEQAERIAKKWCIENGYELERRILALPQVRRLIRKKGDVWLYDGCNKDFADAQIFFNAIWEPEGVELGNALHKED